MRAITIPIREEVIQYNWLITDYECNCYPDSRVQFNGDYIWISGSDLIELISQHDIQFIWAVFSAFPVDIPFNEILKHGLPVADGYTGFWKNPISLQHPLAVTEIVPWDSSLVLAISKNDKIVNKLQEAFPQAENLKVYNMD